MTHPFLINMFTALTGSVLILIAITVAGDMPCGGPKKSPHTSSIVQIIFSFRSFSDIYILINMFTALKGSQF